MSSKSPHADRTLDSVASAACDTTGCVEAAWKTTKTSDNTGASDPDGVPHWFNLYPQVD